MVRPGAMFFAVSLGFSLMPGWTGYTPSQGPARAEEFPPASGMVRAGAISAESVALAKPDFLLGHAARYPFDLLAPSQDYDVALDPPAWEPGGDGLLRVRLLDFAEPSPTCPIPPGGGFPFTPSRSMPDEQGSIASLVPSACLVIGSGLDSGYPDHDFLFQPRSAY